MIANGSSCKDELMGQLLEWSPYVLVLDGALERVLMQGIKVDAVIGDFDSISVQRLNTEMEQQIEWVHTPDQNKSDFDKGLEYLIDHGHKAVNILWATGRRLDHTLNNLISIGKYAEKISINLLDDYSRAFVLPKMFSKYYPAGSILSLLPLTSVSRVQTQNLVYPLDGIDLTVPLRSGSSNEVEADGLVEISHDEGILFLMECSDTSF